MTLAARAGARISADGGAPLLPPIAQSTVQAFPSLEVMEAAFAGAGPYYYRDGHASGAVLEEAVAALEGAEASAAAASGMAAISAALLAASGSQGVIVADRNSYGGTRKLLVETLPRLGLRVRLVDALNEAEVAAALPGANVLHLEALTNPTMRVPDLRRLTDMAHAAGALVSLDATFVSPALLRPTTLGVDFIEHSLAKYIGGHAASMGGVVSGSRQLVLAARGLLSSLGGSIGAFDAFTALLGLKTLPLRMARHSENARAVAQLLAAHPAVSRVDHPSLPGHREHARAAGLFPLGAGGMLSFELHGGYEAASRFVRAVSPAIPLAPSFADVASTLSHPASSSHRALSPVERAEIGVSDGLLRFSVGLEDIADLRAELLAGLEAVS